MNGFHQIIAVERLTSMQGDGQVIPKFKTYIWPSRTLPVVPRQDLGETVEKTKVTPPSLIKATPNTVASNTNDVCPTSVNHADDVMWHHQAKTRGFTLIIVLLLVKTHLRAKLLHSHSSHCHRSNKHYKWTLMGVLLDSASDRDLFFAIKDKSKLLSYSKSLVPQLWITLNGIFQTKC